MNPYIGHPSQLYGVEEHRIIGGKGDQMRVYQVKNGLGLECTIVPDRCLDIYRLSFKGVNCGYFSPCGYVHPAYYDDVGSGFVKSFTAGFLTTCGLTTVGTPEEEDGVMLPLHGTIGHTPAESSCAYVENVQVVIRGRISDGILFGNKLSLERKITVSLKENTLTLEDTIANEGDDTAPLMQMYHMNMGYPLLSEKAKLTISEADVAPRDDHAAEDFDTRYELLPPTPHFQEQCYLHTMKGDHAFARLENKDSGVGLEIAFDPHVLPRLTEWKMMGVRDYVLGLEPALSFPSGRVAARKEGTLEYLQPGEERKLSLTVKLFTV
ncbi:MAG: DUF4432 family protein [Clostridiales bacterium]|nr:DUF4432 family protein [Clostridiales bacterium]